MNELVTGWTSKSSGKEMTDCEEDVVNKRVKQDIVPNRSSQTPAEPT